MQSMKNAWIPEVTPSRRQFCNNALRHHPAQSALQCPKRSRWTGPHAAAPDQDFPCKDQGAQAKAPGKNAPGHATNRHLATANIAS